MPTTRVARHTDGAFCLRALSFDCDRHHVYADEPAPRYVVHVLGNGSTGFAREFFWADSFADVTRRLRDFARGTGAEPRTDPDGELDPGAVADVYVFDARDGLDMTHGDYPLARFQTGPRGGVQRVAI